MGKDQPQEGKGKQQQGKGKVPNAYDINPGLMQGLAEVNPDNLVGFLYSNPELTPEHFKKSFVKNIKGFFTLLGADIVGGIALNMVLTRVIPSMLILPNYARLPLRLAVFCLPAGASYPTLARHRDTHEDMIESQFLKIQRLRRTGNIEEYFRS